MYYADGGWLSVPVAADLGIIPQDLMADEELVKMLPAFFRTMRGQKPTEAEMQALVEKIRKS